MDAVTADLIQRLAAQHPRAAIRLTHQFLDGTEGRPAGFVPLDWDEVTVVVVRGQWWR